MRSVYGDHQRFIDTYFKTYRGQIFHRRRLPPRRGRLLLDHRPRRRCDQCLRPPPGHRGSGKRAGGQSQEWPKPPWSAIPHDIKGQGIYAYVTLKAGVEPSDALADELKQFVGQEIGPIAKPDVIQFAPGLPKTRSGKIMRRILRKIAEGDTSNLGDISTLADPSVVDDLVKNAKKMMLVFFWILASMGVAYAAKLTMRAALFWWFDDCSHRSSTPLWAEAWLLLGRSNRMEHQRGVSARHERGIAIHRGGQLDILLRHAAGVMGGERHFHLVVDIEPFGMMVHFRRLQRHPRHEGEGGVEIHELEFAGDGFAAPRPVASRAGA